MKKKYITVILTVLLLFTFVFPLSGCFTQKHNESTCPVCSGVLNVGSTLKEIIFSMTMTPGTGGPVDPDKVIPAGGDPREPETMTERVVRYSSMSQLYDAIDRVTSFPDISKWQSEDDFDTKGFLIRVDSEDYSRQIGYSMAFDNTAFQSPNKYIYYYSLVAMYDWNDPDNPGKKTLMEQRIEKMNYKLYEFSEIINGVEVKYYYASKYHSPETPYGTLAFRAEYIKDNTCYNICVSPYYK